MPEQIRPPTHTELTPPPGGGANTIFPDEEQGGYVQVGTGLYSERLPVAGMSVTDIRQTFADRLDIDPNAQPVIDGHLVTDESTRIQPGQQLAFVRHAGEKGVAHGEPKLRGRSNRPRSSTRESECAAGGRYGAEELVVAAGLYQQRFAIGGLVNRTVAGIRHALQDRLDIAMDSYAVVNGEPVRDETARSVTGGDTLYFVAAAGEMG